jgi:serine protease Do
MPARAHCPDLPASAPRPAAMHLQAVFATLIAALFVALALPARAAPDGFADLVEKVSNSVVNITTSTIVEAPMERMPMVPEGSPFEDFFRDFFDEGQNGQRRQRQGTALGSGFVISADGYIVTNNHVIEGADDIEVEFFSGTRLNAKVVGTDPKTDIALLKVESEVELAYVPFGDSNLMRVGDWVMAMGNPLGQGFSVSAGIVSARGRTLSGNYDDYLQTDAAINRGNSGGPLFNMDGEVVGVNTAILSPNGGSIGIGFAMASNVVTKVVAQLREFGETRRGWLGVRIQDVTPEIAEAMGLAEAKGVMVIDASEGPAADAGIIAGDVIVSFDGADVANSRELVRRVGDAEVGKPVEVVVMREGKARSLTVTLGRLETAEGAGTGAASPEAGGESALLGMTLRAVTESEAGSLGLPAGAKGLVVTGLDETSEAFAKGLRPGDVITEAGQSPVASADELAARVEDAREAGRKNVILIVRRAGDPRIVTLGVGE